MTKPLPPLYPLCIPPEWAVQTHELRTIYPQTLATSDSDWELLGEDLLQVKHKDTGVILDVGWYPEASPTGHFKLVVINGTDWANPLVQFRSRSLDEIAACIEENLTNPSLLEHLPSIAEPTLVDLVAVLEQDPDENRVIQAIRLLLEQDHKIVVPLLMARLTDPQAKVRYALVDALRRIGDPATGAELFERFLLPEPDLDTRRLLLRTLGAVKHRPAIPILIDWLKNPDPQQRAAAASSLNMLNAIEALPAVTDAYAIERNRQVRDEMRTVLYKLAQLVTITNERSDRRNNPEINSSY
ncbi:HEAT repeat domain-containing protein [Nostoc sp.]